MKTILLALSFLLFTGLTQAQQKGGKKPAEKEQKQQKQKKSKKGPVKSSFACPMHPDVTSDKPGTCSKCGMQLKNVNYKNKGAEHKHSQAYACPMKCEGSKTYDQVGKCPVCKMDLAKVKGKEKEEGKDD